MVSSMKSLLYSKFLLSSLGPVQLAVSVSRRDGDDVVILVRGRSGVVVATMRRISAAMATGRVEVKYEHTADVPCLEERVSSDRL